jgi:hypothetical protein
VLSPTPCLCLSVWELCPISTGVSDFVWARAYFFFFDWDKVGSYCARTLPPRRCRLWGGTTTVHSKKSQRRWMGGPGFQYSAPPHPPAIYYPILFIAAVDRLILVLVVGRWATRLGVCGLTLVECLRKKKSMWFCGMRVCSHRPAFVLLY